MRHPLVLTLCLTAVCLTATARAQEYAQDPAPSDWQPAVRRGRAAFEAERWAEAVAALGPPWQLLADHDLPARHEFACELGAARIRTGESGVAEVADSLSAGSRARRAECATLAADAFAARGEPMRAAALYLHARVDGADVTERFSALPENTRRDAERLLTRMRSQPVRSALGPVASVDAMIERLQLLTWISRPTRFARCFAEEGWSSARRGVVTCSYSDAPQPVFFGGRGYPLESFVWERTRAGLRVVASFAAGLAWDCEHGHLVQPRRFERLTRRQHGIDGYLLSVEESWEEASVGNDVGSSDRTLVYACSRSTGTCARVEEDVARCTYPDPDPSRVRCTERYAGTASVRDGRLTIRIDSGELPEALRVPIDLRSITPPAPAVARQRSMRGCRVEVRDPNPPLNVRANPARRAPVVGTVDEGAVVVIAGRATGRWVEIREPVRGYVWAQHLRRVCGER